MKTNITIISALFFILASCNQGPKSEKAITGDATEVMDQYAVGNQYVVNTDDSYIEWYGYKPTGSHHGRIYLEKGNISIEDRRITGGSFTIDMKSIENIDLEDPEWNGKLVGHLKSEDFFHVDEFPYATFEITGYSTSGESDKKGTLTGNLTMKGVTKSVSFPVTLETGDNKAKGISDTFTINRTQWDVNYKSKSIFSNLKDDFINDEMELVIHLHAE